MFPKGFEDNPHALGRSFRPVLEAPPRSFRLLSSATAAVTSVGSPHCPEWGCLLYFRSFGLVFPAARASRPCRAGFRRPRSPPRGSASRLSSPRCYGSCRRSRGRRGGRRAVLKPGLAAPGRFPLDRIVAILHRISGFADGLSFELRSVYKESGGSLMPFCLTSQNTCSINSANSAGVRFAGSVAPRRFRRTVSKCWTGCLQHLHDMGTTASHQRGQYWVAVGDA